MSRSCNAAQSISGLPSIDPRLPAAGFRQFVVRLEVWCMSINHADFWMGIKNRLGSFQGARCEQIIGR